MGDTTGAAKSPFPLPGKRSTCLLFRPTTRSALPSLVKLPTATAPALVTLPSTANATVVAGTRMGNNTALEGPPPGAGLTTVTLAVAALATSAAPMVARTWLAETNVVFLGEPFQRTTAPATKFVPRTVRVKALCPGWTLEGING